MVIRPLNTAFPGWFALFFVAVLQLDDPPPAVVRLGPLHLGLLHLERSLPAFFCQQDLSSGDFFFSLVALGRMIDDKPALHPAQNPGGPYFGLFAFLLPARPMRCGALVHFFFRRRLAPSWGAVLEDLGWVIGPHVFGRAINTRRRFQLRRFRIFPCLCPRGPWSACGCGLLLYPPPVEIQQSSAGAGLSHQ